MSWTMWSTCVRVCLCFSRCIIFRRAGFGTTTRLSSWNSIPVRAALPISPDCVQLRAERAKVPHRTQINNGRTLHRRYLSNHRQKLISVPRHGLVKVEPRPGEMVGVGARRKTPNRQMRPVASSDSLSDASTNPLLKLLVFCSKTQHKRRSSATGDRNAQRLADNTAAAC